MVKKKIRKETTRQRPETNSREAKIKMLVAAGLGNQAIWSALEKEYPQIIEDNKERFQVVGGTIAYDGDERARVSRALNSTRALSIKDDERVMSIVEAVGGNVAEAKTLDKLDMLNRHRFSCGIPELDEIYGVTRFVHLTDADNSQYRKEIVTYKQRDAEGVLQTISKECENWFSGYWKAGDPMIPCKEGGHGGYEIIRDSNGCIRQDLNTTKQLIESGCPESFMDIFGGEPGVGKTKLAIALCKSVNRVTEEPILYVNGEDSEENFRMKVGNDANPYLFRVITATMLPVQRVCDEVRRIRPRIVCIDSVQTLAEWDKGTRGQKSALLILRALMEDVKAGKPHIILISQLNKQNELKGARELEHLADMVANVTRIPSRKGWFLFNVERKNRGNDTPRHQEFCHTESSVVAVAPRERSEMLYQLRAGVTSAMNAGIEDPAIEMDEEESEE